MEEFVQQLGTDVIGHVSGWDRLRLRGTLRSIAHAAGLAGFLERSSRELAAFGQYAKWASERLRQAAMDLTERASRPWIYLASSAVSKEQKAREIAEADGIREGLICMLSAVEPCWSFRLVKDRHGRCLGLQRAYRKCLHIYQYHVHPRFGFMHLRQQTWMPFNLHVCLNGREWLSRQLDEAGLQYHRRGNCFPWIEDVQRAQQLLDQQVVFKWERELSRMRAEMSPAIQEVLAPYQASYYWSIEESEWATDIMFASEPALSTRYPSLIRHGIESLSVM